MESRKPQYFSWGYDDLGLGEITLWRLGLGFGVKFALIYTEILEFISMP
jgi:hypothetical protein